MAEHFSVGEHVGANFGGGDVIAHYVSGPHENAAGETKHTIQAPDGSQDDLTYRERPDRDAEGAGSTFWTL